MIEIDPAVAFIIIQVTLIIGIAAGHFLSVWDHNIRLGGRPRTPEPATGPARPDPTVSDRPSLAMSAVPRTLTAAQGKVAIAVIKLDDYAHMRARGDHPDIMDESGNKTDAKVCEVVSVSDTPERGGNVIIGDTRRYFPDAADLDDWRNSRLVLLKLRGDDLPVPDREESGLIHLVDIRVKLEWRYRGMAWVSPKALAVSQQ